ncbi:MAG: hypothetical protein C3F15_02690 [Holophagae bacterium]|nr:MAG: hypothetical protein C3F15_02690 [Holophagae bacterium]
MILLEVAMRSPSLLALLATGAVGALLLAYQRQHLPEVVASHFGASGVANGWMPRDTHCLLAQGLFVFLTAMFCFMGWMMLRIPAKWVNLPNKGHWFAAERETDTRRHLSGWSYGFGAVVNLFLIFAFHLVYRANLSDPVAFDSTAMMAGLIAFVVASIGATIVLFLRYGRTP